MSAIQKKQLFVASCLALITTSMTFAFRAALEGVWSQQFNLSKEQIGWIFSPAFWGFTLAMVFGGPLCDLIGMKRLIGLAFVGHVAGICCYLLADNANLLFAGTVCIGIANGMVEAACNPLIVSLFPENKTTMLNRFHVWFPGGIVLGGLIAYFFIDKLLIDWKVLVGLLFITTILYGILFYNKMFPKTERVESGISFKAMVKACVSPLFIVMVFCMFMTAATELGTNQWITALLGNVGISGILILVLINGVMAIGRSFAGPIVHKLNPNGMLIFSAIFSSIGLALLSQSSGWLVIPAALLFAAGICFFWPTMLGFVSENIPQSGALGLSLMGGAGMFSTSLIVPLMGKWYDTNFAKAVTSGTSIEEAVHVAGSKTLLNVAFMPAALIVVFSILYFLRKRKLATS